MARRTLDLTENAAWDVTGAGEAGGKPEECEFEAGEFEGPPEEAELSPREELAAPWMGEPIPVGISPEDGLPVPADASPQLALAPSLTYDNVCIADDRTYVERFTGDQFRVHDLVGLEPDVEVQVDLPAPVESVRWVNLKDVHVLSVPYYTRWVFREAEFVIATRCEYDQRGKPNERHTWPRHSVEQRWGRDFVVLDAASLRDVVREASSDFARFLAHALDGLPTIRVVLIPVRPTREVCRHYRRSVMANDDQRNPEKKGHRIIFRNCTERRTVGGALMSVSNECVYACEHRSPPDPGSVKKHLDAFDEHVLRTRPDLTLVPLFGLPAVTESRSG